MPIMDMKRLYGYLKYNIVFNDTVVEDLSHFSWPHVVSNDNGYSKNASSQTSEQD